MTKKKERSTEEIFNLIAPDGAKKYVSTEKEMKCFLGGYMQGGFDAKLLNGPVDWDAEIKKVKGE